MMIPLDSFEKWRSLMESSACLYLNENEYKEYNLISEEEKKSQLKALLEHPIANFTPINHLYFRAKWDEILKMLYPEKDMSLLEIASGDADMIPQLMERTYPDSKYVTANMNKILNESLLDDAIIVMNHYMFQLDLDWGYPHDLFENIIPMTRDWVSETDEVKEIYYEGFDLNWWMFLKKLVKLYAFDIIL